MPEDDEEDVSYYVVVNDEEQYSILPTHLDVPPGWSTAGAAGPKAAALARIEELWTDMRPRSLRVRMEMEAEAASAQEAPPTGEHEGGA